MKQLTVALLLISIAPSLAPAQSAEEVLKKLEADWTSAMLKKDFAFLSKIMSDDFTWVDSEGTVWSKAQAIAVLKSGEDVITSSVIRDLKVRVWGDTAVVIAISTNVETLKGKDVSGTYRFTDTWVKRAGSWQCVASHSSKIAKK